MVVAINVRVEVRLKVKRANRVINTINASLNCRPQSLTGIDMGNPTNILLRCVLDNLMGIEAIRRQAPQLPEATQIVKQIETKKEESNGQ